MATANDIVKGALRKLGVKAAGQALTAEEGADGLSLLNDLLESWALERLMLQNLTEVSITLTANDEQYTIGSGGDKDTTRPVSIESAYIRDSSNNDTPVAIISDAQYSRISGKTDSSSTPAFLYYRPEYPLGKIYLYPRPDAGKTLYLSAWLQFTAFASLSTTVALPPGYKRALEWNLALEISPEYRDPKSVIFQMAQNSKSWIKTVNSKEVPILRSEAAFIGRGGFDINTGESL